MRVLIATMGTMGDLEPYLALVRRLLDEGHDVRFTSQDGHAARCAEAGVPFTSIGITDRLYGRMRDLMPLILAERRPLKQLELVTGGLAEIQLPALPALRAMVREVDLVVHAPPSICAVAAARAEGIPDVSATHSWPAHPATEYGPANIDHGPVLNTLTWRWAQQLYAKATDPPYNKIVTAAGLPRWRNITYGARRSALLDLVALSPAVLPLTRRAAPVTEITGYWFLDEDDFTPPPDLAEFLTGPPPLVIGLGSTASTHGYDKHGLARIVAEAVTGLEHRVIVQGDFLREAGIEPGPNVFVSGRVPYLWLFRRAIGVVHQGGGGTAAAAFRAGIPQAIVSHVGDQPEWGRRVAQLGVGPVHCPYTRLDTAWLASALRTMAQDTSMVGRARVLGAAVRAEDGTGRAVRALERVCSNINGKVADDATDRRMS